MRTYKAGDALAQRQADTCAELHDAADSSATGGGKEITQK